MADPISCIATSPTSRSVKLGDRYINLHMIARANSMDPAYLSRIFSGKRDPGRMSINQGLKLAAAVGMSLEALIDNIYSRRDGLARARAEVVVQHQERVSREKRERTRRAKRGLPVAPDFPLDADV